MDLSMFTLVFCSKKLISLIEARSNKPQSKIFRTFSRAHAVLLVSLVDLLLMMPRSGPGVCATVSPPPQNIVQRQVVVSEKKESLLGPKRHQTDGENNQTM
jgi:hypothetical protein